jgi:hypothetical protein
MDAIRDPARTGDFSVAELCCRGWNRRLVVALLGDPDFLVPNPHVPGGADMRLYTRARVEEAERGEASGSTRTSAKGGCSDRHRGYPRSIGRPDRQRDHDADDRCRRVRDRLLALLESVAASVIASHGDDQVLRTSNGNIRRTPGLMRLSTQEPAGSA